MSCQNTPSLLDQVFQVSAIHQHWPSYDANRCHKIHKPGGERLSNGRSGFGSSKGVEPSPTTWESRRTRFLFVYNLGMLFYKSLHFLEVFEATHQPCNFRFNAKIASTLLWVENCKTVYRRSGKRGAQGCPHFFGSRSTCHWTSIQVMVIYPLLTWFLFLMAGIYRRCRERPDPRSNTSQSVDFLGIPLRVPPPLCYSNFYSYWKNNGINSIQLQLQFNSIFVPHHTLSFIHSIYLSGTIVSCWPSTSIERNKETLSSDLTCSIQALSAATHYTERPSFVCMVGGMDAHPSRLP